MPQMRMIALLLLFLLLNLSLSFPNSFNSSDYPIGDYYFRVHLFEYDDSSDIKFLKFNIDAPTKVAVWSITVESDRKCNDYPVDFHFDLQYGAYPLFSLMNESFPNNYVTNRHDLILNKFNQTVSNRTITVENPSQGTWFAMVFIERLSKKKKSKSSSNNCNHFFTTWLDYEPLPIPRIFNLNEPLNITLLSNVTSIFTSFYLSHDNDGFNVISNLVSSCDILILVRINALPNFNQYDYRIVCPNGSCSFPLESFSSSVWLYFQLSVNRTSCPTDIISGSMSLRSKDCSFLLNNLCLAPESLRRVIVSDYYNFLYAPASSINGTNTVLFNTHNQSIYGYEFIVDDRNIGGTVHIDFNTSSLTSNYLKTNLSILGCISKYRLTSYENCEDDYKIVLEQKSLAAKSLPYPEMAYWYVSLQLICNDSDLNCGNSSLSVTTQIWSSPCTKDRCGRYGTCRVFTTQQNIFSACICIAGYRGYGCTDDSHSYVSTYLSKVLFLTLSNLMFIPAVILAVYYRLYIEALVYFFNMFFSTFYHACDQEIFKFCVFQYDGLQLSDFIGSYASFVVTLITMAIAPRALKIFLFMVGVLTCVVINSRDRFDDIQFIVLICITFVFTISTWIRTSIKCRHLHPSLKELLLLIPGLLLAITGLVLFVVVIDDENYWYVHSLWHMFMAGSILFFIPRHQQGFKECKKTDVIKPESNTSTNLSNGIINPAASLPLNDIS